MSFSKVSDDQETFLGASIAGSFLGLALSPLLGAMDYGISFLLGVKSVTSALSWSTMAAVCGTAAVVGLIPNLLLHLSKSVIGPLPGVLDFFFTLSVNLLGLWAGAAILGVPVMPVLICTAVAVAAVVGGALALAIGLGLVVSLIAGGIALCQNDRVASKGVSHTNSHAFFQSEKAPKMVEASNKLLDEPDVETCDADARFVFSSASAAA